MGRCIQDKQCSHEFSLISSARFLFGGGVGREIPRSCPEILCWEYYIPMFGIGILVKGSQNFNIFRNLF